MNVVMISHFYAPEPCAASNRAVAVAAALRDAGHKVRVITGFPNFPQGRIPVTYRGKVYAVEMLEGIQVFRVWTYAHERLGAKARLMNWLSTAIGAAVALCLLSGVEAIYVSSPPITMALPAIVGRLRHHCRLVVDIRDAYPEVAVRLNVWRSNSPLTRIVGLIADVLYQQAARITCVTESVRRQIAARGVPAEKIVVAANGVDYVDPSHSVEVIRQDGEFVAAFTGNMGIAAGLDVIIEAAALLSGHSEIRFILAGDGSEYTRLRARVEREGLGNVAFLGAVSRRRALALLRDSDICLVTLKANLDDSLPTKIFDALYVSRPVLLSGDGEARRFLEESGGGWQVRPEDPQALASAILRLAEDRNACAAAGARGQEFLRLGRSDRADGTRRIVEALS